MSEQNTEQNADDINKIDDQTLQKAIRSEVAESFCIDSADAANWLVRKIVSSRQYAERVKVWAEQELRRAEREEHTLMFLFGRQLEGWVRSELERLNGKKKSLALPAGSIGFRTIAMKLVVDDEQAVLTWAKANCPNAVLASERLLKSVIDERLKTTGETPDVGVHIEPSAERFFIK
jgi:hypothetical protein